eukprot:Anaeramoba_ignava/a221986_9.p1 GENE.a221986_9~~a221986_9.p1  ORF type:complete len:213 (-),score=-0.67 a221986_9:772-1410(-)
MGISERKQREKERRKSEILDAAEKLFFSKGFDETTMDDVAENAELSKGTLYLYFKNKEELFLELSYRGMEIMNRAFEKAIHEGENGLEQVKAIGLVFYEFMKNHNQYFRLIMKFKPMTKELSASKKDDVDDDSPVVPMVYLFQAIENGKADGSIRQDINTLHTALLLMGQSTGVFQLMHLLTRKKEELIFDPEKLYDYFVDFVRRSLIPDKK